jgi:hypothetical protein
MPHYLKNVGKTSFFFSHSIVKHEQRLLTDKNQEDREEKRNDID